jgi:hypothetical protein
MPVWLRRFTFSELDTFYKQQKQEMEKAAKGSNTQTAISSTGKANPQAFGSSNTYRASKK